MPCPRLHSYYHQIANAADAVSLTFNKLTNNASLTAVIGDASPTRMEQIDQALRRWLML